MSKQTMPTVSAQNIRALPNGITIVDYVFDGTQNKTALREIHRTFRRKYSHFKISSAQPSDNLIVVTFMATLDPSEREARVKNLEDHLDKTVRHYNVMTRRQSSRQPRGSFRPTFTHGRPSAAAR